jgi:MFS transporter, DHA2 family, metal-tetracycline-proton antiporter
MPVSPKKIVPWIAYLIFFSVLNETVFNVSTPKISQQFGLGPSGVGWMMTIFMVFFGIGSMIYGKLSDIFVIIARYVSPEERGRIFGLIMSTVSFGVGLGPFVAGSLHWSYLYRLFALPDGYGQQRVPDPVHQ